MTASVCVYMQSKLAGQRNSAPTQISRQWGRLLILSLTNLYALWVRYKYSAVMTNFAPPFSIALFSGARNHPSLNPKPTDHPFIFP
ncbi:hypothetical protein ACRALDRAFT_2015733 [Sodiomyces alcalophilus JCM 7366]|uniref:uncharacterized protein n=1 Tax=Sodiomyces alcalophilus JCM 7366 TaxID=591952 RepID=UPI0039B5EDFA